MSVDLEKAWGRVSASIQALGDQRIADEKTRARFFSGAGSVLARLPIEVKVHPLVVLFAIHVGEASAKGADLFNDEPTVLGRWTKEPGMWTQEAARTLIPCFDEVIIDPHLKADLVAQIIKGTAGQRDLSRQVDLNLAVGAQLTQLEEPSHQQELVSQPSDIKIEVVDPDNIFDEMIDKTLDRTKGSFPKQGLVSTTQITPSVGEQTSWELVRAKGGHYYSLRSRISFPFRGLLTEADILGAAMSLSRRSYDIGGPQISDDRSQMTIKRADLAVDAHLGYTSQVVLLRARNQIGMEINNQGEVGEKSNFILLSGHPRQSEGSDHEKWGFALSDNREGRERFADNLDTFLKIRNALVEVLPLNR